MTYTRYAIYFTPPIGPLSKFGASWLGWDLTKGEEVSHPDIQGLKMDIEPLTRTPRKYGFHATMKPPFRLAEGMDFETLRVSAKEICASLRPVQLDGLTVKQIGRFLALTPIGDETQLNALAGNVVKEFDRFRAPATDAELARRRKANLSARQDEYLVAWGYPYVFDEFHFHMTLTGRIDADVIGSLHSTLADHVANILPSPFEISELTLVGEGEEGQFFEIERFALEGV